MENKVSFIKFDRFNVQGSNQENNNNANYEVSIFQNSSAEDKASETKLNDIVNELKEITTNLDVGDLIEKIKKSLENGEDENDDVKMTTLASNEEGGDSIEDIIKNPKPDDDVKMTTLATNEEGGDSIEDIIKNPNPNDDGITMTTMAVGEEGGSPFLE